MPYIKSETKMILHKIIDEIRTTPAMDAGELNFLLTELCRTYLKNHGTSYAKINDIVGALEGAKLEFYRRIASPYEDETKWRRL